jgi:DNA excision repair protein ERCC-2
MHEIEQGMIEGAPMLIQAPTGLGKTVGVLYPVLKEALSRGQKVVYVTPKTVSTQLLRTLSCVFRRRVHIQISHNHGKNKICFKNEPCNP